jgi:hypothetical protein
VVDSNAQPAHARAGDFCGKAFRLTQLLLGDARKVTVAMFVSSLP